MPGGQEAVAQLQQHTGSRLARIYQNIVIVNASLYHVEGHPTGMDSVHLQQLGDTSVSTHVTHYCRAHALAVAPQAKQTCKNLSEYGHQFIADVRM